MLAVGALGCIAATASAQPIAAGLGAFTGSTVVDFNATANEQYVAGQYSGLGVTFSGLVGMTNSGDTQLFPANGGGVIASNWLYSRGSYIGLIFAAKWTSLQSKVGFYLENWPNQTGVVEIYNGNTSLGTINFAPTSSLQAQFFGLQSAIAFDSLRFTNDAATNGFYAIDDFQYVGSVSSVTPEPATVGLVATGLIGILAASRRRRHR